MSNIDKKIDITTNILRKLVVKTNGMRAEKKKLQKDILHQRQTMKTLQVDIDRLSIDKNEKETKTKKDNEEMDERILQLKTEINVYQREKDELHVKVIDLRDKKIENEKLKETSKVLKEDVENLEILNKELKKSNKRLSSQNRDLQKNKRNLENKGKELEELLRVIEQRKEELRSIDHKYEMRKEELEEKNIDVEEKNKEIERENKDLIDENRDLKDEETDLSVKIEKLRRRLQRKQTEVKDIDTKLEKIKQINMEHGVSSAELERMNDSMLATKDQLKFINNELFQKRGFLNYVTQKYFNEYLLYQERVLKFNKK